jgi:hypothetical protein
MKMNKMARNERSIIGQFLVICLIFSSSSAYAEADRAPSLKDLNPLRKEISRGPNSFVPRDDFEPLPFKRKEWTQEILVEDNSGVLVSIRKEFKTWQEREDYAKKWNLESTGLYVTPRPHQRKAYLSKKMLKYLDKRLSGEIKGAEKGSTLHRVGQVQKALKPNVEAKFGQNIKLKLKARVLQGRATIHVKNPWIKAETDITVAGDVQMNFKKDISAIGVKTHVRYEVKDGVWIARLDRALTDKLTARLSSTQNDKQMVFSEEANKQVELLFNHSF